MLSSTFKMNPSLSITGIPVALPFISSTIFISTHSSQTPFLWHAIKPHNECPLYPHRCEALSTSFIHYVPVLWLMLWASCFSLSLSSIPKKFNPNEAQAAIVWPGPVAWLGADEPQRRSDPAASHVISGTSTGLETPCWAFIQTAEIRDKNRKINPPMLWVYSHGNKSRIFKPLEKLEMIVISIFLCK